jgi:hypothetical protein
VLLAVLSEVEIYKDLHKAQILELLDIKLSVILKEYEQIQLVCEELSEWIREFPLSYTEVHHLMSRNVHSRQAFYKEALLLKGIWHGFPSKQDRLSALRRLAYVYEYELRVYQDAWSTYKMMLEVDKTALEPLRFWYEHPKSVLVSEYSLLWPAFVALGEVVWTWPHHAQGRRIYYEGAYRFKEWQLCVVCLDKELHALGHTNADKAWLLYEKSIILGFLGDASGACVCLEKAMALHHHVAFAGELVALCLKGQDTKGAKKWLHLIEGMLQDASLKEIVGHVMRAF